MAAYWTYREGQVQYRTNTDLTLVRFGQLGGLYVVDRELEIGGFALAEDTGWERLQSNTSPFHVGRYREGVRLGEYVLDSQLIDGTWEQII